jgi:hypothetical protein
MRRYLVVSHQTLSSKELLAAMQAKAAEEATSFHLLVPMLHSGQGMTWTEGQAKAQAQQHLDEALRRFSDEGLEVTGAVGADNPVDAVDEELLGTPSDHYAGIIVSTLPKTLSKWLKIDVPSRVQRKTTLPVEHLIGHPAEVSV